jgi:MacB-like periplasmic core domain
VPSDGELQKKDNVVPDSGAHEGWDVYYLEHRFRYRRPLADAYSVRRLIVLLSQKYRYAHQYLPTLRIASYAQASQFHRRRSVDPCAGHRLKHKHLHVTVLGSTSSAAGEGPRSRGKRLPVLGGEFDRQVEGSASLLSYPEYLNYRDRVAGISGLAASADVGLSLGGYNVERISGLMVTDNYFSLLGGGSAAGRTFFDKEFDEYRQAPLPSPVAVLSYGFWQRRYGSDPSVIGTSLTLNRQRFTVIGVAARLSRRRDERSRCLDSSNDATCGKAREQVSRPSQL